MNSQEYMNLAEEKLLHVYNRFKIVLDKGDGVYLYDVDGKKYLDFAAGIAVFALGYNYKSYNDALKNQIDKVIHTSNLFYNVPAITAAQKNYDNFLYADTDSVHAKCLPSELIGIPEHPTKFNHWKYEAEADQGIYVRAKRYIEHVILEDHEAVDPYYNIKCAGMPDRCKELFNMSLTGDYEGIEHYNETQQQFARTPRTLKDFKRGLKIEGKLVPKRIKGGVLLVETSYEMR